MKKWIVTYTLDQKLYTSEEIEGGTYTQAYLNTMVKHSGAIITDIKEA